MAASATYILKSVGFTPTGGSLQSIDGAEEFIVRQNGQVVAHFTDAAQVVQAHFIDGIDAEVTVRTRNASWYVNSGLQPGVTGVLVAVLQKRARGKGAVAGQDKTITSQTDGAMVGVTQATLPQVDRSTAEFPFHCSDPSGVAPLVYS